MDEIGVTFRQATISEISDSFIVAEKEAMSFDRLVFCAGSSMPFPAIKGACEYGYSVDTYDQASRLDAHLDTLDMSCEADRTIVVVGASFTGIETVTKLRDRLDHRARLILIDQAASPGATLGENLSETIAMALSEADILLSMSKTIDHLQRGVIALTDGSTLKSSTVIFTTGFVASPLTRSVSKEVAADGRICVEKSLRIPEAPTMFAAGDVAKAEADAGHPTLMSCQHAMPMGAVAGRNAVHDLAGCELESYTQPFYATCLDLGPAGAVFTQGWERQIAKSGAEGAAMKAEINRKWIYPPDPSLGRDRIFSLITSGN